MCADHDMSPHTCRLEVRYFRNRMKSHHAYSSCKNDVDADSIVIIKLHKEIIFPFCVIRFLR